MREERPLAKGDIVFLKGTNRISSLVVLERVSEHLVKVGNFVGCGLQLLPIKALRYHPYIEASGRECM